MSHPALSVPVATQIQARLHAYLLACGLPAAYATQHSHALASALGPDRAEGDPDPVAVMAAALGETDRWALTASPVAPDPFPPAAILAARARLLLSEAPARWPEAFLTADAPPEMQTELAAVTLQASPPLWQTTMTPQPLYLGPLSDVADETWRTFDKWPVLRGLTLWTLFFGLLGTLFYMVRF